MHFANDFDIFTFQRRFRDDPVLGPASQTLANLRDWTNRHSDGWAYWPLPVRAANQLITLLEAGMKADREGRPHGFTGADLRKAYAPIRAFRTRYARKHGIANPADVFADFEIVTMAQLALFGSDEA